MTDTRQLILNTTAALLEKQGYHATGLSQVIAVSGAPKGSLYYHFPGGKEQIAAEAVLQAGENTAGRIAASLTLSSDPAKAVVLLVERIAQSVENSGFSSGGPLTTVAGETVNGPDRLNQACRQAFDRIQAAFAAYLADCGRQPDEANELAGFILATIEGAILLSRTQHDTVPLRRAGHYLAQILREQS